MVRFNFPIGKLQFYFSNKTLSSIKEASLTDDEITKLANHLRYGIYIPNFGGTVMPNGDVILKNNNLYKLLECILKTEFKSVLKRRKVMDSIIIIDTINHYEDEDEDLLYFLL